MDWTRDMLGTNYERTTIGLGPDPDGEGDAEAVLVRRRRDRRRPAKRAVLWVHGFSDYFFQTHLADYFAERGYAFYALDLRKCGRARRPGQTPHFVTDLAFYDTELDYALAVIREETGGAQVLMAGHSTGGLVLALWLDRLNARPGGARGAGVSGLLLDGPWLDLQGSAWLRSVGTWGIRAVGAVQPFRELPLPKGGSYGRGLHVDHHGEWTFDTDLKPLEGFPVVFGWLAAIRRGQARFQRGLDIGVPSLVLRSDRSRFARDYRPELDTVDCVVDVAHIARWAGCLGNAVTSLPIEGARHDVFLSLPEPRAAALAAVTDWLDRHE